jgi:hypothetical protein
LFLEYKAAIGATRPTFSVAIKNVSHSKIEESRIAMSDIENDMRETLITLTSDIVAAT